MRNYKLIIAYDGSRYKGWQRLSGDDRTLQSKIEEAISKTVRYKVSIDGAGRTDAGVHARGQVANVTISKKVSEEEWKNEINERLPSDIQIVKVELVKKQFHSRLSAKRKCYSYTIDTREKPHVFSRKYTLHYPKKLEVDKMKSAARLLNGTNDFTAFCDKKDDKNHIRTIYDIEIKEKNGLITIYYYGSGFLNHMVRIMTGTLLEIGRGEKDAADIKHILKEKKRANAGYTVPAMGLCLEKVYYE